jgi:serine acetyltransferase
MADIGADVLVAAGAVVVQTVADSQRVAGIPARPIPSQQSAQAEAA